MNKPILDACCGGKMFYFDKNDPRVLFQDIREVETTLCDGRVFSVKPTAYWFINAQPTCGLTEQLDKLPEKKRCLQTRSSKVAGLCSKERSMISADYARNFICDCILGKAQKGSQLNLFE